jgi:DNA-directed RNA polymerase subunit RPC12/RpoP
MMTFQYMCPQGHLLEGDPAQAGQQVQCPTCGVLFVVPTAAPPAAPVAAPAAEAPPVAAPPAEAENPFAPSEPSGDSEPSGRFDPFANVGPSGGGTGTFLEGLAGGGNDAGPKMVHVPCPAGHILETPQDTMGQTVMCPHCGEMFDLLMKNTLEFKRDKKQLEEKRTRRTSELWFRWAIATAILIVVGLIAIIATLKS